ncbi:unnamed protein product [Owenia fusiformis]|uniref:Uncharacterized protein n=1 Tax=Owenia fusiformis TaxID=6347 RepID=A0A8S4P0B9_OWEFU|nr:unnamed protein product [Owenia fusiformis]
MIKSVLIPYDKYIRLENSTRKTEEGNNKTIDQSLPNTDKMDGGIGSRKPSHTKQVDSGSNDASTFSSENKLDAPSDSDFKEDTTSKQNYDAGLSASDDDDAIGMPSDIQLPLDVSIVQSILIFEDVTLIEYTRVSK